MPHQQLVSQIKLQLSLWAKGCWKSINILQSDNKSRTVQFFLTHIVHRSNNSLFLIHHFAVKHYMTTKKYNKKAMETWLRNASTKVNKQPAATPPPKITWLSVEPDSIQPDVMDIGVEWTLRFLPKISHMWPWSTNVTERQTDDMRSQDRALQFALYYIAW